MTFRGLKNHRLYQMYYHAFSSCSRRVRHPLQAVTAPGMCRLGGTVLHGYVVGATVVALSVVVAGVFAMPGQFAVGLKAGSRRYSSSSAALD